MDEARQQLLQRNIYLLRALRSVEFFMLMIPIIVVYYKSCGMTMHDVMLLQAIFSATMVLIEIPSGYFSDVLGRRRTLIIGSFLIVGGFVVYCFVNTFSGFLIAELVLGVGAAFVSGTDSAMLYDTLLEMGNTTRGVREEGRQLAYGHYAEAASGVIGGLLAVISLKTPIVAQAAVMTLLIPISFMLREPQEHRRIGRSASFAEVFSIAKRVLVTNKSLRWMLASSAMLGASTLSFVWLLQPYMLKAEVPLWMFGTVWTLFMLVVGFSASFAHKLTARFTNVQIVTALSCGVVIAYVAGGIVTSWVVIPIFLAFYVARGISNPVFTTALNVEVESHERATVLSVRQLGVRLVFVIVGPAIGFVSDATSLNTALLTCAILFGVLLTFTLSIWHRVDHRVATASV
ncbi:MAG: MFS transporter [Ignavibacteria bacterium]|nr:MFS transporter [Ignavibacteria bacterium]